MCHGFMLIAILAITINMSSGQKTLNLEDVKQKTLLEDIKTITLYRGKETTGRRTTPVAQMKCVGGYAGCYIRQPTSAQCYNKGTDGNDVQWECVAELNYKYKFGKIEVVCEGYEYPQDPYILTGSCGLEYTIEYTMKGRKENHQSIGGIFLLVIIFAIIGSICSSSSSGSSFMGGVATGAAVSSYYRSGYGGQTSRYSSYGSTRTSSGFGGTRRR